MRRVDEIRARTRRAWRAWLAKHHRTATGVWLVFPKKATGLATVSYNDAVEEALCFGWIDGLMRPVDETCYKQMFTPRKPASAWARSNKERAARLIEQGLMTEAGRAAIETAKANGSWDTYTAADALTVPPDLRKAIAASARARKHWPEFTDSQRRTFLYWLALAKREDTRVRRIAQIVDMLANKITPSMNTDARRAKR